MSEFKAISQDRLKVHFLKPEGKISRRELLKLVLPHYEVVPFIEPALCRGSQECGLCLDACPLEAVKVEAGEVIIDTTGCSGCGACVEVCPHRAIIYPTFSLEALDKEMEDLLSPKNIDIVPRMIAAVCQRCLPVDTQDKGRQFSYPAGVLSLAIPCLAMVSPWLILRAFDMGAQGFALISGRGKCRSGFDSTHWQENVRFVHELLDCWGIGEERIKVFEAVGDEPGSIEKELTEFAAEIAGLAPTRLRHSEPTLLPSQGLRLPALIKGVGNKLNSSSKGVVLAGAVPLGKVELDRTRCTGCGLCALNCPTEALVISSSGETDAYQLLFRHEACVACGRCVEVCPEKCLRLKSILELDRLYCPPTVLCEDVIVRCSRCGSPIGPRTMIDNVRAKVLAAGQSSPEQFELCPTCKVEAQLGLGRT